MKPERRRLLYAITPDLSDSGELAEKVEQALAGGAGLVQYRNKQADARTRREQADLLKSLCARYRVPLIINDHLDLALSVGADGLHLGAEDGDLRRARLALNQDKWLGASCYNRIELAQQAITQGASYIAFGAVFGSNTKPQAAPASLDIIRQARRLFMQPLCAIGGITLENAPAVLDAGADWLAVIGGLFNSSDIVETARAFALLLEQKR